MSSRPRANSPAFSDLHLLEPRRIILIGLLMASLGLAAGCGKSFEVRSPTAGIERILEGELGRAECHRLLQREGVDFRSVRGETAPGVEIPVRVADALGDVRWTSSDSDPSHEILDCRLAVALLAWAPILREAGVHRVEHFSIYRRDARTASGRVSGHGLGLAVDASRFFLDDGTVLSIQSDWRKRRRGVAPCPPPRREPRASRLLRTVVCEAAAQSLFQVVLTPHYDRAHADHLHLELRPGDRQVFVG